MKLASGLAALLAAGTLIEAAAAQTPSPDGLIAVEVFDVPDEFSDAILKQVIIALPTGRNERGERLGPLPAGSPNPLLPRDLVKEIIVVGLFSGMGEECGLDWQKSNFLRLMQRERARGDRSTHQIAAIAMIHGVAQSGRRQGVGKLNCSDATDYYKRKWGASQ